jgi:ABC-type phosphate transport system permease subunit
MRHVEFVWTKYKITEKIVTIIMILIFLAILAVIIIGVQFIIELFTNVIRLLLHTVTAKDPLSLTESGSLLDVIGQSPILTMILSIISIAFGIKLIPMLYRRHGPFAL